MSSPKVTHLASNREGLDQKPLTLENCLIFLQLKCHSKEDLHFLLSIMSKSIFSLSLSSPPCLPPPPPPRSMTLHPEQTVSEGFEYKSFF